MEWMLDKKIFQEFSANFGTPKIDLFASRINTQLADYVSYLPDPSAIAVDALSFVWENDKLYYMFPPFSILGQTLQKLETDTARAIIVVPLWTTQHQFSSSSQDKPIAETADVTNRKTSINKNEAYCMKSIREALRLR